MTVDELAAGKLDALPTGSQFIRVINFHQAPGQSFPSRKHQPGIIYQSGGGQVLGYSDGQRVAIVAGRAAYQRSAEHAHTNTGADENTWYFLALWPTAQRGTPLVVAGAEVAYETEDLPASALAPAQYVETLQRITLQPGGRSAAHRLGGNEVVFVLDGAVTVKAAGRAAVHLVPGEGTYLAPDIPTQEIAAASAGASYLVYVVIAVGRAFATDLDAAPAG